MAQSFGANFYYSSKKGHETMKYCPHCGAVLPDGAFSFCPACGKPLPETAAPATEKESPEKKKKPKKTTTQKPQKRKKAAQPALIPSDDGYDGYYDDRLPIDSGKRREGMDMGIIKKAAAIVACLLVVIGACIALLYVL